MRWIGKGTGAPLVVLMFHGLVECHPPYANFPETRTCMLPVSDFTKILGACARRYRFTRLADVPRYFNGEAEEPGVLITFDDGLASVCELAAPILLRYGATATQFVTTQWIDNEAPPPILEVERELWWRAPVHFGVQVGNYVFEADVKSRAATGEVISRLWAETFSRRCVPSLLKREHFFFEGRPWKDSMAPVDSGWWLPASWDSLRSAVRSGALEIGAHGVTHTPWTWLEGSALDDEIAGVRRRLEQEFDRPVDACAYPHGLSDGRVSSRVGEHFRWAFGGGAKPVVPGVDRTYLPRFYVPSEHPNGLATIVSWPRVGYLLREGARLCAKVVSPRREP